MLLWQGQHSVLDYPIDLLMLAAESGWNQLALVDTFYNGVSKSSKRSTIILLDACNALASKIDKKLSERQKKRSLNHAQTIVT